MHIWFLTIVGALCFNWVLLRLLRREWLVVLLSPLVVASFITFLAWLTTPEDPFLPIMFGALLVVLYPVTAVQLVLLGPVREQSGPWHRFVRWVRSIK